MRKRRYFSMHMAIYGNTQQYMVIHGYTLQYMAIHANTWIKLAAKTVDEDAASCERWICRKEIKSAKI